MKGARFRIEDAFFIENKGTVIAGTLLEGTIRKRMKAIINGIEVEITDIMIFKFPKGFQSLEELWEPGSAAGLLLKGINKKDVRPGEEVYFQ